MGKEQSLGIVSPIPKDEWSATKEYQELNIVRHGNAAYISKKKNIGIEPSISANWAEYWMLLMKDTILNEVGLEEIYIDKNDEYLPPNGKLFSKVTVNVINSGQGGDISIQEKTVQLQLVDGDQEVYPDTGYALSKVKIVKPNDLIPSNIRAGASIAGVNGEYTGSSSTGSPTLFAPSLSFAGDEGFVIVDTKNGAFTESYEVYADDILIATVTDKNVTLTDYVSDDEAVAITARALSSKFITSDYSNSLVFFDKSTSGLSYSISTDGTYYSCTGMGTATATNIVIASQINGAPVREIKRGAFSGNTAIKSVIVPNSVTIIFSEAFRSCSGIESVKLGSGLKIIDAGAFNKCSILTSITLPDGVEEIYGWVFKDCTKLTSVYLPNTPPTLQASDAFSGISSGCVFYCKTPASLASYKSATNWSSLTGTYKFQVE